MRNKTANLDKLPSKKLATLSGVVSHGLQIRNGLEVSFFHSFQSFLSGFSSETNRPQDVKREYLGTAYLEAMADSENSPRSLALLSFTSPGLINDSTL